MTKFTPTAAAGALLGGRYRVETELGRGGMGVVYACLDEPLGRKVAVKTLSVGLLGRDREARMRRFQREVQALVQLDHGGILHIYDAGEADDPSVGWVLYYAMELIEGETLSERLIRGGAMERGQACAVVLKCAEALGTAHNRGIVHRDVKPANIFLAEGGRVVVADFGVCKIEGGTEITRKDQMVGTPSYLAPEQILGLPVDPRTDVFALGALLYVLITNSALRPQLDRAGLSRLAATDDAANRARAIKGAPDGLPQIIARALARDPKDRYPSGTELAEALEAFATRVPQPFEDAAASAAADVPRAALGGGTMSAFTSQRESSTPGAGAPARLPVDADPDTLAEGGLPPSLSETSNPVETAGYAPEDDDDHEVTDPVRAAPPMEEAEQTDRRAQAPEPVRPAMQTSGPGVRVSTSHGVLKAEVNRASSVQAAPVQERVRTPSTPAAPVASPAPDLEKTDRTRERRRPPALLMRALAAPPWMLMAGAFAAVFLVGGLVALLTRTAPAAPPVAAVAPVEPAAAPAAPAEPVPAVCLRKAEGTPNYREVQALVERAGALDKKEPRKAQPLWEKALAMDPQDWQAHRGLARTLKKTGHADKARVHLLCVVAIRPGTAEADEAQAELR
ncbi:MAG: protein kinase [Deltaproteobacteria bacterium]|nr:protein kinase [Deltaproteobacteria bacterium]